MCSRSKCSRTDEYATKVLPDPDIDLKKQQFQMIVHIFSDFLPSDPEDRRRHLLARETWPRQPWIEKPVPDSKLPRLFVDGNRRYPYVRDIFDFGCEGCADEVIVCFTNSDIFVRGDACQVIAATMQSVEALYSRRRDFHHKLTSVPPDADYVKGHDYPGKDLFAFRVRWWREVREHWPEMILGFEAWDAVMQEIIELTNDKSRCGLRDIIAHCRHSSRWERSENRYTLPGQKLCLRNAYVWMVQHGIAPSKHGIRLA